MSTRSLARFGATAFALAMCLASGAQAQAPTRLVVDSVIVRGAQRIQPESVSGLFGILPGDEVMYRDIQRGLKTVLSSGQFRNVTIRAEGDPAEPIVLIIEVEEELRVRRIEVNGLEHANANMIQDTVGLEAGRPLNRQRILEAKALMRSELAEEGIPFANIQDRLEPVEGSTSDVDIIIDVEEGQRITVAEIEFIGNEGVSDDELRGSMDVSREGFWWFATGSFNQADYDTDLEVNLPAVYRSRGYLDAAIVSDTVLIDPTNGKARVEVSLEEGVQYRMNDFNVEGNQVFEDPFFQGLFTTPTGGILSSLGFGGSETANQRGGVFDAEAFEAARGRALERYRNQGYLYADITPIIDRIEPQGDAPALVNATWQVNEGPLALIRRINVVGNEYTHEWVIRNQLTVIPGDVYSQDRLLQSYQSISALGFFEVPMPLPDIQPDPQTGDVDITFEVVEKQTGSINFGTSVGGGVGLSGFIGYEQPNLFGQAKSGTLRWDFGRFLNSFEVGYNDPSLMQSRVSGSLSLFNSRDRFFQFASGRRKRIGATTRFGFPVQGSLFTRAFLGYSISKTTYELFADEDDASLFGRPPGVQSQLSLGLTRQTLDHPIFPSVGSRQNLTVELNGGLLGGDGQFTRVLTDGQWWLPVGRLGGDGLQGGLRMSVGLAVRGGAVFGNVDAFPFDRFWMGGVQFGQSVRGYDETSITPLGYFPELSGSIQDIDRLGNAFIAFTSTFAMRPSDQISLNLFYDAGNVYRRPGDFDPTRLYRGAGFGVQLVTPFGPIGLDYAYGFDKPDPGWQLHFRMGGGN